LLEEYPYQTGSGQEQSCPLFFDAFCAGNPSKQEKKDV
jgi:hypothetical protein